jgi:hypothetical protein
VKDWSGPRLEPTVNERVEARLLDVLTRAPGELAWAKEALHDLLCLIEYDCQGLAERAGKAADSVNDDVRRDRWLAVKAVAEAFSATRRNPNPPYRTRMMG